MNSRERVLTTLHHEEPDRVPIDLDGMAASGIAAMAYNGLKRHLDVQDNPTYVWDPMQLLAVPDESIVGRFAIDTAPVRMPIPGLDLEESEWEEWTLPDGSKAQIPAGLELRREADRDWVMVDDNGRVTHRLPEGGYYFDRVYYPLADATTVAEIEAFDIPDFSPTELVWMAAEAEHLYETTDRALLCRFRGSILEKACSLRGWQQYMTDLVASPKLAHAVNQRLTDHYLKNLRPFLDAVGDYSQVIVLGDDLGNQNRPLMSPDMYRKMIKPYHQQIYTAVREESDLYLFMHSDGNIRSLIPDIIDLGVDILNPVQTSAQDMEAAALKQEFGDDLVFWGAGIDTQHVLPFAEPAEVRQHVREVLEVLAPGGGFVFTTIHNIQANVPPENIVAMYEAVAEFGSYG